MKMRKLLNSENIIVKFPFLAKYTSKYGSLLPDIKSLIHYYILRTRITKTPSIEELSIGKLIIMTTTICNGNCVFCAYRYFKDRKEIMPFKLFKKIVDDYRANGGKLVNLTPAQGDPLTDPGIFEKIVYLNKCHISCMFYTNAILLEKNINRLINLEVKEIHIDIGDIIPKYDSKVFQIPLSLSKKRLGSILKLLEEVKKTGCKTKIDLAFRPMRSPSKIFKDFKKSKFWKYHEAGLLEISFLQAYDNWGGAISEKDLVGVQTLKRPMSIRKFPCVFFYNLSLLPNGDARICGCRCLKTFKDELVIGNINDMSLKEMEKSRKWKDIIRGFQKGKIPKVCRKCSFYRPLLKN